MTLAFILAAIRRHPFSIAMTAALLAAFAGLIGVSIPLALGLWIASGLVACELWYTLEPFVLRNLVGAREPSHAELDLLDPSVTSAHLQPLILDESALTARRGLRCLLVSRDALELLDERPLVGLLHQACAAIHTANLGGVVLVWFGNVPLLGAWFVGKALEYLGGLLGVLLGESLLVPLVAWRGGFVRWSGRVFGLTFVGLLGSMFLSSGFAAVGALLLVAWVVVPAMRVLLDWETRRVERAADQATVDAGFGAQLLEALELLLIVDPQPRIGGFLGVVYCPGAPYLSRAKRIRDAVSRSPNNL